VNLTSSDISYLRKRTAEKGYNADDLLSIMNYESSGRPDVWGGKGGKYFGLLQFGPNERKQFGVDTVHPSAQNQIDAGLKFLEARGFKPGMGRMDMYSTVLAGSPGHYNRSDGAGTVAQHVARMQGPPSASPMDVTPAVDNPTQPAAKPDDPIARYIAANFDPEKIRAQQAMEEAGSAGMGLLQQAYQPAQLLDAPAMQPMPMNAPIPQANRFTRGRVRGLLG